MIVPIFKYSSRHFVETLNNIKSLIRNWILSFKFRQRYPQYLSQKRNRLGHCAESNFMFVVTSVKVTYIGY
jgi:hypothetical protein